MLELATLNRFVFSGSFEFYKSLVMCHALLVLLLCKNLVVGGHSLQQFFCTSLLYIISALFSLMCRHFPRNLRFGGVI
jgi:hypothetical protein